MREFIRNRSASAVRRGRKSVPQSALRANALPAAAQVGFFAAFVLSCGCVLPWITGRIATLSLTEARGDAFVDTPARGGVAIEESRSGIEQADVARDQASDGTPDRMFGLNGDEPALASSTSRPTVLAMDPGTFLSTLHSELGAAGRNDVDVSAERIQHQRSVDRVLAGSDRGVSGIAGNLQVRRALLQEAAPDLSETTGGSAPPVPIYELDDYQIWIWENRYLGRKHAALAAATKSSR